MKYIVYILRCSDGTFYTGITTDLKRRLSEHNEGENGAKYTKSRRPITLVYQETAKDRSAAQSREYALRQLTREKKRALIKSGS